MAAPERGAAGGAQHVRVGQRVAQQALERDAGDGEAESHDQGREHARQTQLHDDGLRRLRPGLGHRPAQQVPGQDGQRCRRARRTRCRGRCRPRPRRTSTTRPDQAQHQRATAQRLERAVPWRRARPRASSGVVMAQPAAQRAGSAGKPGQLELGMDGPCQRGQTLRQARAGPRHGHVVDRPDGPVDDRRHVTPAGPRRHVRRADAVVRVAHDDDLRVGHDELAPGGSRRRPGRSS